ncbi:hypothetical protein [Butyrivibrio sp. INlla21]|uniref:hypothetical protein n=1 Tax=Butyrivibrio sp. INlla21 TaxID=1520811 RepID=UPI0008EDE595|nr:hypothetical protein [Butyrivibrio sp. INlla21]SFU58632.1 hypothetical protein SAMN02910342_01016 [Butyrivibrio sp. INlla21]
MEENRNVIANDATGAGNVTATSNDAILTEIRDLSKKRLFYQKISTCCIAGMLAVLLICVLIVIPKVSTTLSHINSVATKAETSIESIDKMTDSILKASENMNKLVDDNGENLAAAVKSLSEIDFEGLNKAITDLQDAVGPLASLMKKLGR